MTAKIFKILAASVALCAATYLSTELATARGGAGAGGGGSHIGGGGGHFSGGGGHFSGGAGNFGGGAHFSGGVGHFGGGAHFGGANIRGFGGSHISGAHVRGLGGSHISGGHIRGLGGSHISGTHIRGLSGSHISGTHVRGLSGSHISGARGLSGRTAWNQWGNHTRRWHDGRNRWHGGWGGWGGGSVFWPYFYGDLFAFAFWPWGYYDPFWAYGDIFVWDAMFWPGPDYAYGTGPFDVYGDPYAYARVPSRTARIRNVDRQITDSNDLAQTCSGLAPGVTDLPIGYIQEKIQPTGEQLKALDALKAASSQASDALKASCSTEVLLTPLGRLDTAQKRLDGMIQAVGIVRTPLDNFFNSLSDEQKQRFARLGPASDARKTRRESASVNDLAALCSRRTENFTQLPVDRIEQFVKPTQEQQDAFARLKIASTEAANHLQASCPTQTPQTLMDRFDAFAKRLDAMAAAIRTVRPELASFYGSLTDEQKARFNTLGPPPTKSPHS